ncbi:2-succinyl-6-hydroxy-2,4-cyclohexadiene-1-carboxylate synthase [Tepidiforma sp.]|uniref:2-succinyl-6-hydroxy-2, 4-cyclohexadiene-1-carboxylate synthase n=1 Tax=Tepidiforma sp. TaxID=2682230 RepID=UPI002ADD4915|nr:2-succinyl-6-hydroxy-2,4-cyclohexadiene-1-carboxylate synthase [Tepidiforma sp.]
MTRYEIAQGFSLNVESWGSGPPLVLLHGFTGSADGWGEFGRLLGEEFRCIAIDIVGHGHSDAPEALDRYRMPIAARDLLAAARRAGAPAAAWLGYSMGGRTAIAVTVTDPGAVTALVTIGASPGLPTAAEREQRIAADEALADRILSEGIEAFVDYWESLPLWESQSRLPADVRAALRAARLRNRPIGLANSLRGMGTGAQPDYHDALRSLPMPFLALAGALDSKYLAIARQMAEAAPNGRFASVPGAGHAAQLEAPAAAARLVAEFLHQHHPMEAPA